MAGSHILDPVHGYTSQGVTRLREDHSPSCILETEVRYLQGTAQLHLGEKLCSGTGCAWENRDDAPAPDTQMHAHPENPTHSNTYMCAPTRSHTHSPVYAHIRALPRPGQAPTASVSRRLQLCSWWSLLHSYVCVCMPLCACVRMSAPRANVVHPMSARVKCQHA